MKAVVVAHTQLVDGAAFSDEWRPDPAVSGGENLVEAAGRACYQSWARPNPATASNAGYLAHIVDVGHFSVLEHGTVTFYLTGVSRSFTHELVRHRHLSYSQLSQRYINETSAVMVCPDLIAGDPHAAELFNHAVECAADMYEDLVARLDSVLEDQGIPAGTARRKAARQAARSVLPNATETRIVVTGNYRAWRHFIDLRATEHADVEIRAVAVAVLDALQQVAPNVFADYELRHAGDGSRYAVSSHAERS